MIKQVLKAALFVAVAAGLTACGGGGGSGNVSTGGTYFTHEQLAQEFVRRVNVDVAGYNLALQKTNTLQTDYIVVYDRDFGTYDAYWLGNYNPGESIANYIIAYDPYFYYDLDHIGGNVFEDWTTGIRFQKIEGIKQNLTRMKGSEQRQVLHIMELQLQKQFGVNKPTAKLFAKFAFNMQANPGKYGKAEIDSVMTEGLGASYSDILAAKESNDYVAMGKYIATAQAKAGIPATKMAEFLPKLGL